MKKVHLFAAITALALLILGVLVIDRSPPVKFVGGRIEPIEVAPGSANARISRSVLWNRACSNVVTRYVKDAKGWQHKIGQFSAPVPDIDQCRAETLARENKDQCIVHSFNLFPVSAALPQGSATYHVVVNFECGVIGKWFPIKVEAPPLEFIVR